MHNTTTNPAPSGRGTRRTLHLGAAGLATLTIGFAGMIRHNTPHAFANEFEAIPDADIAFSCNAGDPIITVDLYNTGNQPADFTLDAVVSKNPSHSDVQVVSHEILTYHVPENSHASVDVASQSGKGFSQHFEVDVECANEFTGSLALICQDQNSGMRLKYDSWNANGVTVVQFVEYYPDGTSYAYAAPGHSGGATSWPVQEGQHVVASLTGDGQLLGSIDTVVDCVPDPPPTSEPPTTPPPTTGPPSQEPPPSDGELPETGDDSTGMMTLFGASIAAAGLGLIALTRRPTFRRR